MVTGPPVSIAVSRAVCPDDSVVLNCRCDVESSPCLGTIVARDTACEAGRSAPDNELKVRPCSAVTLESVINAVAVSSTQAAFLTGSNL